jgi:hypothetical protein
MKTKMILMLLGTICCLPIVKTQVFYPGDQPGKAVIDELSKNQIVLGNKLIGLGISVKGSNLFINSFTDKVSNEELRIKALPVFELTLQDGSILSSDDFNLTQKEILPIADEDLKKAANGNSLPGKKLKADFVNKEHNLNVHWEIILRDDANYIRQVFTFTAGNTINISKIGLIKFPEEIETLPAGKVDGSPIVHQNMFFAVEHPMSQIQKTTSGTAVYLARSAPLNHANPFTISSVWGVTPAHQLRRGFLYYVERERAHPYHQMLHYNSWYDLSWEDRILNDSLCLDRIYAFRDSLIVKRGVHMDAFLFDDGWDDYKTIWQFHSQFPQGFTNLKKAVESVGAGIGVWMSPWGGYDIRKPQRLEYGAKQNPPFETNENGFTLTGPVYYAYFTKVATDFIKKYGVSIFKLDGVGEGNEASGANLAFQSDIEAFLKFTGELRKIKPDIYLSLTIGTWPSVYFLKYGDATWRSGDDTNVRGKGSRRQQWINYRDSVVYVNVVHRAPLYPLNSIMYHGITIGNVGIPGTLEMNDKDIADEIWSFFGSGTSLQEMYINPHKLNTNNWNCLARAAKWAKGNESVMPDVHWIGGDPSREEVYGYAAWSPEKAYISLRNPSEEKKSFVINASTVFDLPDGAVTRYQFFDARSDNSGEPIAQGQSFRIDLEPYQVKVLNAVPLE